jgi:acetamidase/formamidase
VAEHTLRPDQIHHKWDNSLPPAIEIEPGDIVHCETAEVIAHKLRYSPLCQAPCCVLRRFG